MVDGREGTAFMKLTKAYLERPENLLVEKF